MISKDINKIKKYEKKEKIWMFGGLEVYMLLCNIKNTVRKSFPERQKFVYLHIQEYSRP